MDIDLTSILTSKQQSAAEFGEHVFYRLGQAQDRKNFVEFISGQVGIHIIDEIDLQLRDLVKLEHPTKTLTDEEYTELIQLKLGSNSKEEYGVWVHYPWRNQVIHLLDEIEFVRVRTIRNAFKITPEEQALLGGKKIGVVGLSVGQSVALALAMERIGGEIRVADFDHLELSNMNRIRTGVGNLGMKKGELVRREIAEIDPFIRVEFYDKGLTKENALDFLTKGGQLDAVVEECDSPDVKLMVRKECARLGIPVVMETSDRGVLDIERYDLDKDYPMLHGLISKEYIETETLSLEQKRAVMFQCIDVQKASERGRLSLGEIGKTITTWPQLATDVILGGAVAAMAVRMILLNNGIKSSRTYVDVPSIISQ
ncbi:MAG: ThiF family adenylyltransferase [Flavobacteriales bacterium]